MFYCRLKENRSSPFLHECLHVWGTCSGFLNITKFIQHVLLAKCAKCWQILLWACAKSLLISVPGFWSSCFVFTFLFLSLIKSIDTHIFPGTIIQFYSQDVFQLFAKAIQHWLKQITACTIDFCQVYWPFAFWLPCWSFTLSRRKLQTALALISVNYLTIANYRKPPTRTVSDLH